jgi:peptidoglycan/xylan/chitin deacetylase (PgdA/CDA1 family)
MFSTLTLLATLALAALAHPKPSPTERALHPRASPDAKVYSSCKNSNQIALTFDDGPYIYLRNISDQLTKAGAKGTFFMNG